MSNPYDDSDIRTIHVSQPPHDDLLQRADGVSQQGGVKLLGTLATHMCLHLGREVDSRMLKTERESMEGLKKNRVGKG